MAVKDGMPLLSVLHQNDSSHPLAAECKQYALQCIAELVKDKGELLGLSEISAVRNLQKLLKNTCMGTFLALATVVN